MQLLGSYGTGVMVASLHHLSTGDAETLLGLLIVVGCLIAAGVLAFRSAWIAALALCGVAIVAALLLL